MASSGLELTGGALARILDKCERVEKPVLKLLELHQGAQSHSKPSFVLTLSDGVRSYDCIVHSDQLIQRLCDGQFQKSAAVVLNDYKYYKMNQFFYINDMSVHRADTNTGAQNDRQPEAGPSSNCQPIQISTDKRVQNVSNRSPIKRSEAVLNAQPSRIPPKVSVPLVQTLGPSDVQPINTITINSKANSWIIRGRVTSKGKKRKWDNQNGQGCLFSFVMTDPSGQIRIYGFNRLCDKYLQLVEENKVYRIRGGIVRAADKRFSNLANNCEILLSSDSKVEECPPEESFCVNVCQPKYRFIPIKDLDDMAIGSVVDVIGAVQHVGQCYSIASRGQQIAKRDITLVDNTGADITLSLWKEMAEQFECQPNAIIAVQSAVLKDFGGRTLTAYQNTDIKEEPTDVPEVFIIKEWLKERERQNLMNESLMTNDLSSDNINASPLPVTTSTPIVPAPVDNSRGILITLLDQINENWIEARGQSIQVVKGRISFPVNRCPIYKSCHRNHCFKKVEVLPNGLYRCRKCAEETPHFQWRYFLVATVADCTDEKWLHLFDAEAAKLIGLTAQELSRYTDQEQYEKVLHSIEYKLFYWRVRPKLDRYFDKTTINLNVISFWPSEPIKEAKTFIKTIQQMTQNNG